MPLIVSFFVRQLIIIGVQLGIFAAIDRFVTPLLNGAIQAIVTTFGVNEDVASDILANEVLTLAESLGLTVLLSRARIPLVIADKLKFTTRGFRKRRLPTKTQLEVTKLTKNKPVSKTVRPEDFATVEAAAAKAQGILPARVRAVLQDITAVVGGPLLTLFVVAQFIDFAAWNSSAYQNTFKGVFAIIGLKPDEPLPRSQVLSSEVWKKVKATYENAGAVGINDPYKLQTVLFTEKNLIDLVDQVAANLLLEAGSAPTKAVIGNTQALIIFKETTPKISVSRASDQNVITPPATTNKVFLGAVGGGKLTGSTEFTPRPDDLIQNMGELEAALRNNLTAFLPSLIGRFVYETKVVSSVITKDGFKQRGEARQIQVGTNSDGSPKLKTVVNKFAVADIYLFRKSGSRSKVETIVLGPTDAVNFNPKSSDLGRLDLNVKENIYTTTLDDVGEVSKSGVSTPLEVPEKKEIIDPVQLPKAPDEQILLNREPFAIPGNGAVFIPLRPRGIAPIVYVRRGKIIHTFTLQNPGADSLKLKGVVITNAGQNWDEGIRLFNEATGLDYYSLRQWNIADVDQGKRHGEYDYKQETDIDRFRELVEGGAAAATASGERTQAQQANVCRAGTLFAYYGARGEDLPSVEVRSILYEQFELGPRHYYTGTAEQNIRLLAKLKAQEGCGI